MWNKPVVKGQTLCDLLTRGICSSRILRHRARGRPGRGDGELVSAGVGVRVVDEASSGGDGGNGCPAVRMSLAPSSRALKWLKRQVHVACILTQREEGRERIKKAS